MFRKNFFQMFIGVKLDSQSWIYYNSATSPMKQEKTGQRTKLSIRHKKPSKLPTSGSPANGLTSP